MFSSFTSKEELVSSLTNSVWFLSANLFLFSSSLASFFCSFSANFLFFSSSLANLFCSLSAAFNLFFSSLARFFSSFSANFLCFSASLANLLSFLLSELGVFSCLTTSAGFFLSSPKSSEDFPLLPALRLFLLFSLSSRFFNLSCFFSSNLLLFSASFSANLFCLISCFDSVFSDDSLEFPILSHKKFIIYTFIV